MDTTQIMQTSSSDLTMKSSTADEGLVDTMTSSSADGHDVIQTLGGLIVTTTATMVSQSASAGDTATHLHYVMSAVIGPIVCILGMLGNILAVIIWNRPGMNSSTGRYLTAQAVMDFGVLLFFILCDSAQKWTPSIVTRASYAGFFCYIGYPLFFFFVIGSIWMTVGVTIDRYIMVCWIAKAKEFCNTKRANFGIFLVSINCFLINIPHYMSFRMADNSNGNKTGGAAFEQTEFGAGDGGKFYEFWIHCIVLILIPWVSVFAMNMKIIKKIGKSNQRMADKKTSQSVKKSKQSENQVTRLLLAVTFSFLFFIGIQCIVQCLYMQQPDGADLDLVSSSFAFAKTGIVFNSSLNFVFYCLMGRRFRKELFHFLRLTSSKDAQLSSLMDTSSTGTSSGVSSSSASNTGV